MLPSRPSPAAPARVSGWVTADSRYRFTVNGRRVQWGPAPSDPRQLDVDPIDLTPYLQPELFISKSRLCIFSVYKLISIGEVHIRDHAHIF